MNLRPFSEHIWDSFNGAEKWEDGTEPMFGEHTYGHEEDMLLIVDCHGIEIHFMKARDEVSLGYKNPDLDKEMQIFLASSIMVELAKVRFQEEGVVFVTRLGFTEY